MMLSLCNLEMLGEKGAFGKDKGEITANSKFFTCFEGMRSIELELSLIALSKGAQIGRFISVILTSVL